MLALFVVFGTVGLAGCDDGGFEEAGEEIDQAGDEMEDELDEAADELN